MPKAEYVPYSTVKPEELRRADEKVQINFPLVEQQNSIGRALAQVGEQGYGTLSRSTHAVGEAFDKLGSTFEHVGDQLWQRAQGLQEVQNQTTLTKAEIEYDKYAGEKQVAFNQLQGDAASEGAYKAHLTDLEDKRKQMLEKLPNPSVIQRFDKSTASTVGRLGMQAAQHAATETRKAFIASSEAKVDQLKDNISKTDSIEETKDFAKQIHDEVFGKQAPAKGWSIEVANKNFKDMLGDAYASQATRMSREDPTGARKLLEANRDFIGKDRYEGAMDKVMGNERRIQSNNIGNKVQESNPDGSLEEKKAEAKKQAEALGSKDPLLIQAAIDDAEQKHEKHRREVSQQLQKDKELVGNVAYGYMSPHGEVPTTPYELFAYGGEEARKAYERLDKKGRADIDALLKTNAKGEIPPTEATRARVYDLEGMMINEPGRFRDHPIDKEEIPLSERGRLRKEQIKMIREGIKLEADPNTQRALNIMRSNGILPKDLTPSNSKYNAFTGMVREAVIEEGKRQGFEKPLTTDQILTIGRSLLEKQAGSGWFGSDWGAVPTYLTAKEVPSKVQDQMKMEYPGITDSQMLEKYQRLKAIQLYNKRNKPAAAP